MHSEWQGVYEKERSVLICGDLLWISISVTNDLVLVSL